jgi:DNA polymerase-3 subunit epsilon
MFNKDLNFFERPIAITDLEMTGLDPDIHEIIEIGLVVVRQDTFEIIDTLDIKVRPERIETADPAAIKVAGYKSEEWGDAVSLKEALMLYAEKTKDAVFCAQTINNDWAFLSRAFKSTDVQHSMDYHMIDIPSIAWEKLRGKGVDKVRLGSMAQYFGIPREPEVHRAMNGAKLAYEVLKKLISLK